MANFCSFCEKDLLMHSLEDSQQENNYLRIKVTCLNCKLYNNFGALNYSRGSSFNCSSCHNPTIHLIGKKLCPACYTRFKNNLKRKAEVI
jgi:hypothetical protein